MTISVNIDLTKIDKAKIKPFTRKDGTEGKGYNLVIFLNEQGDQFGNNGFIAESVPKDSTVKGAILGNVKILGKPATVAPDAPIPGNAPDGLPF